MADGHGSFRALYGAAGASQQADTYAAFGELLAIHDTLGVNVGASLGSAMTRILYSGEATDPVTGMQFLRARSLES